MFLFWVFPRGFKTRLLWRNSSPTPSSVSHCPMTDYDTICNNSSLPLVDIVIYYEEGLALFRVVSRTIRWLIMIPFITTQAYRCRLLWRGSSPIPSSVSHYPMTDYDTIYNNSSLPLVDIVVYYEKGLVVFRAVSRSVRWLTMIPFVITQANC